MRTVLRTFRKMNWQLPRASNRKRKARVAWQRKIARFQNRTRFKTSYSRFCRTRMWISQTSRTSTAKLPSTRWHQFFATCARRLTPKTTLETTEWSTSLQSHAMTPDGVGILTTRSISDGHPLTNLVISHTSLWLATMHTSNTASRPDSAKRFQRRRTFWSGNAYREIPVSSHTLKTKSCTTLSFSERENAEIWALSAAHLSAHTSTMTNGKKNFET